MITLQEQRLAMFVDRVSEMANFCDILEGNNKLIMVVWGDSGIGKTSLMARMVHECSQREIRKSEVIWTDSRIHNYLDIMRKIRDDVGGESFNPFTDLINFFTVPKYELKISYEGGNISVANRASLSDSSVGNIAGIMIKDVMLNAPRADMDVPEDERRIRLTDQFMTCLAGATKDETLVVFFDGIEKMSEETEKWLADELVMSLSNGKLPNIRLVLCGQKKPELGDCWLFAEESELKPLGRPEIIEYLGRRGVEESAQLMLVDMVLAATKGKPQEIAKLIESYLNLQHPSGEA